jgi:hypothetical protein
MPCNNEKGHGVQASACCLGRCEDGSHKLKLELHALFRRREYVMKSKLAIWIAFLGFLTMGVCPVRAAGKSTKPRNLVENPGFEVVAPDSKRPVGWRQESPREEIAPAFELDHSVARSGRYAAKLSSRGSPGTFGYWATNVRGIQASDTPAKRVSPPTITVPGSDFLGDKAYRIGCYFKAHDVESIEKNVWIRVGWNDDRGRQLLKEYIYPSGVEAGWYRAEKVLVAPKGAHSLDLEFVLQWTKTGTVWWDDVSVQEVDQPPGSRKITVATVHYIPPAGSTPEKNRRFYAEKVGEAGKAGADIVCLGEGITVVSTRNMLRWQSPFSARPARC